MAKVIQPTQPPIFIGDTTVHPNCISIIVGTKIFFVDKESIPDFQRKLDNYIDTPRL